jgi:oligoribonuclease NrnB/cAMP/cGMP phosphodiesterase (DHH superfamily)
VVIYHDDCFDGFTAAYYARLDETWVSAEYIPWSYDKPINPNDFIDAKMLIVDFSFPHDVILELKKATSYLLVIDHHKSAQEELKGIENTIFDMNECGASLTFKFFFQKEYEENGFPDLIKYIRDRDLWKNEMPNTKEVNAWIRIQEKSFFNWNYLAANVPNDMIITAGKNILESNAASVKYISKFAYPCWICGKKAIAVNSSIFVSELGDSLLQGIPVVIIYYDKADKKHVELRSKSVDVAEIAKIYGGGGHKFAAGFTQDKGYPNVWEMYASKEDVICKS